MSIYETILDTEDMVLTNQPEKGVHEYDEAEKLKRFNVSRYLLT